MINHNRQAEDTDKYGSIKNLKYFVSIRHYGRAAKILELYALQLKKDGRNNLAKSFIEKSADFYFKIGWFEKAYHLYSSIIKPGQAKKAIFKRDELQEKFEKTINKEYNDKDHSFYRIKQKKLAQLWEKEQYCGRAAMLQYRIGDIDKAKELIEKEGLSISDLEKFIEECKHSKIIISKTF